VGDFSPTMVAPARIEEPALDEQGRLFFDLVEVMARDIPSLAHILAIIDRRLSGPCGMRGATVFTLDPDDGSLLIAERLGEAGPGDLALAGRVFRASAGAPPVVAGERMAIRLRIGGQTVGVLVLTGATITALRPEVTASVALQVAATLQVLAAERHQQFVAHATGIIRKLFELAATAGTVEAAGRLLATVTGEAFRTECAAVHLIGPDGRIRWVTGVGVTEEMNEHLTRNLIGVPATDSPVWRALQERQGPLLVGDAERTNFRTSAFAQTLGLRSFVAMPLMSAAGPVGMVLCGDATGTRHWGSREEGLAVQMAMEGAMIVDGARMRQAEQQHMAELTRQAYHDALTGLPNRTQLLDRAGQEVDAASTDGGSLAMLLIDLDGFKRINDTVGHHAGDALLHAVGQRVQATVREHDVVARLGGDEFAILLARDPGEAEAAAIAERIHARLCEPFDIDGSEIRVGASIGIALYPADAGDMPALMKASDAAMYCAKRDGGGVRLAA
jgi:diguanylate cyclase (GGDEF)-like protein